jgi:hypothetical protein
MSIDKIIESLLLILNNKLCNINFPFLFEVTKALVSNIHLLLI